MSRTLSHGLDVLFVHPLPFGERQELADVSAALPRFPLLPMGVVGLCNLLRARGHRVRGLNLGIAHMVEPGIVLEDRLRVGFAPSLVLIDLHWHEHALGAVEAAVAVRHLWPSAFVVLGGLTASAFAVEILEGQPAVDCVIRGDAERPLVELAETLAAGRDPLCADVPNLVTRAVSSPWSWVAEAMDLDAVDPVELGFLEHAEAYRRLVYSHPRRPGVPPTVGARGHWLSNGRGCAWRCASCGGGSGAHRRLTGRPELSWRHPARLAGDIDRLRALGIQQVALGLDPDMAGPEHLDACLADLQGIGLYIESFQLPSAALLDALARRADPDHSELAITVLSGNAALRHRHGKRFGNLALFAAIEAMRERDLSASLFFSLGLPGSDGRAFEASLEFARRLLDADRGSLRLAALPQALDPCAPMALEPGAWGLDLTDAGDLAARLARAEGLLDGSIHPLSPRALGYRVPGCDLPARAARWNALAAEAPPGAVIPVPGVEP